MTRLVATLIASLVAAFICVTAAAQAPKAKPYIDVDPPVQWSDSGKIEIVEVFSYGCIHCAHFQPLIDEWRKRLDPKRIEFIYLPAPYNVSDVSFAYGFFAAQSLGLAEKTHQAVFDAVHKRGMRVNNGADAIKLYAQLGVPEEQFAKTIQDFYVSSQARRARDYMIKYKIDSTPTLIVAGKYKITADSAGDPEAMIKVADELVKRELNQSTATVRQAPSKGK